MENKITKPIKAKPSFYAMCFEGIKAIGFRYGYNIVLHGSLDRDLDLIAVPWVEETGIVIDMLNDIAKLVGGHLLHEEDNRAQPHGRISYIINIHRTFILDFYGLTIGEIKKYEDPKYYIDLSVMPTQKIFLEQITKLNVS